MKVEQKGERIPTAAFQIRVEPKRIPWLFAALKNQPQVELYKGDFPEPFSGLLYIVRNSGNQLVLATALGVGDDFNAKYGLTIGSPEDLTPLTRHYPKHEFSSDNSRLTLRDNDGRALGVIARASADQLVIQKGGEAGQLVLDEGFNAVNSLSVHLDKFGTLVRRYVSAIWQADLETDQKKLQLTLDVPALPEGALETYFSTFGIIAQQFREHPRPVELDNIGGYPHLKAAVKGLIVDLTQPDKARAYGTQPFNNRFVLITGREGTGKSLFPKAVDKMMRDHYGDGYEYYRLPLADMLPQYGPITAMIMTTMLEHVLENEKKKIPTLLHVDNLEQLVPPHQRVGGMNGHLLTSGDLSYYQTFATPSSAEFNYSLQTINPIILALRKFGQDIGGNCQYGIIIGESRFPREMLPEGVTRTFRRPFNMDYPTIEDIKDILRVQIETTRGFAKKTGNDPFESDITSRLEEIAKHVRGLVGRNIQQVLLAIATEKKATESSLSITSQDIIEKLDEICSSGGEYQNKRPIGYCLPHLK